MFVSQVFLSDYQISSFVRQSSHLVPESEHNLISRIFLDVYFFVQSMKQQLQLNSYIGRAKKDSQGGERFVGNS